VYCVGGDRCEYSLGVCVRCTSLLHLRASDNPHQPPTHPRQRLLYGRRLHWLPRAARLQRLSGPALLRRRHHSHCLVFLHWTKGQANYWSFFFFLSLFLFVCLFVVVFFLDAYNPEREKKKKKKIQTDSVNFILLCTVNRIFKL